MWLILVSQPPPNEGIWHISIAKKMVQSGHCSSISNGTKGAIVCSQLSVTIILSCPCRSEQEAVDEVMQPALLVIKSKYSHFNYSDGCHHLRLSTVLGFF